MSWSKKQLTGYTRLRFLRECINDICEPDIIRATQRRQNYIHFIDSNSELECGVTVFWDNMTAFKFHVKIAVFPLTNKREVFHSCYSHANSMSELRQLISSELKSLERVYYVSQNA